MNARRTDKKVKVFDTHQQLRLYTKKTGKLYPLDDAKGDVVEVLLRRTS
jgi:predicted flavoprotein YhiN